VNWTVVDDRTTAQGYGPLANYTWAGTNPNGYLAFDGSQNGGAANAYPLSVGGSLPLNSPVSIGAQGTVDLGGVNSTFAFLSDGSGGGGSVINSNTGATAVLTLAPTGGSTTFSGAIGYPLAGGGGALGPLNLVMSGNGTQVLTGANVRTQTTTVQGGVLDIAGTGSSASATNVPAGVLRVDGAWSASGLNVTQNSDGTGQGSGQLAGSGAIALTGSDGMYYNSTAASTFSGDITAPSGGLKVDNGTLVLSGTNNFAVGAAVLGGTLVLADNQALADGSSLTVGAGAAAYFNTSTGVAAPLAASPGAVVAAVPEPGAVALLSVAGLVAVAVALRRRRS
jgi:autotransporter-associated beta strand protein